MIQINELLQNREVCPLLDVRSPGEYNHGHLPGAISFPIFSDEERAAVGTIYKQVGKDEAVELGLRFVGPKLETFVKEAKAIAPEKKLRVHCWRGGQRSGSMAWLFRQAGFDVQILQGGYKTYRQAVREGFQNTELKFVVLGGKTGSGKTKILKALAEQGEQVIDLEGLAHHKGSAFGFIGERPQPTVEQFENELFDHILRMDISKRIWLENESHSIGRIFLPDGFWDKMKAAPLVNIEIPEAARIENLLSDYVLTDREDLAIAFQKIGKKLGGLHLKTALEALERNDFEAAAQIALLYYDKTYQHCLDTSAASQIIQLEFSHGIPEKIAEELTKINQY